MKPTSSSIANLASIAFLLALSTADRHWSVPVSLIGAGIAYFGFAVWTSRKENAQKADRAFREIALEVHRHATDHMNEMVKRGTPQSEVDKHTEAHIKYLCGDSFTYADYLKYKPE